MTKKKHIVIRLDWNIDLSLGLTGNPIAPIDYCKLIFNQRQRFLSKKCLSSPSSAIHNRNQNKEPDPPILSTRSIDHQHDSSAISYEVIKTFFLENLLDKWKILARELDVNECEIDRLARENLSVKEKFSQVIRSIIIEQGRNRSIIADFGYNRCRTSSQFTSNTRRYAQKSQAMSTNVSLL